MGESRCISQLRNAYVYMKKISGVLAVFLDLTVDACIYYVICGNMTLWRATPEISRS